MGEGKTLPSHRRLDGRYMLLQAGFWAMCAAAAPYQASLLLARGFSAGEAGQAAAVRCLALFLMGGFELPAAFVFQRLLRRLLLRRRGAALGRAAAGHKKFTFQIRTAVVK